MNMPRSGASNFIFVNEIYKLNVKPQITPNTVVVGDFNTSLSWINRSHEQKLNREIVKLNDIITPKTY